MGWRESNKEEGGTERLAHRARRTGGRVEVGLAER